MIENSPLFNLTALISFSKDRSLAGIKEDGIIIRNGVIDPGTNTVPWLLKVKPPAILIMTFGLSKLLNFERGHRLFSRHY